jgi:hypothetical protein
MNKAIVIGTRPDRKEQLNNCLQSFMPWWRNRLGKDNPDVLVIDCDGYEIGKIKWLLKYTQINEFVFLQDSIEIKDPSFLIEVLDSPQSFSISNSPRLFGSYLGKYKRSVLEKMALPDIKTKEESVEYEMQFGADYSFFEKPVILFDNLQNTDVFVEKWGKKVMKIEND